MKYIERHAIHLDDTGDKRDIDEFIFGNGPTVPSERLY